MPTISIVVTGRVQGVGFRSFVERIAIDLCVDGEVWNTRGGAVGIVGQHEDSAVLDALVNKLRYGPGHVEDVVTNTFESVRSYDGFNVSSTR